MQFAIYDLSLQPLRQVPGDGSVLSRQKFPNLAIIESDGDVETSTLRDAKSKFQLNRLMCPNC
jgi:hypothetical protein